MDLVQIIQNAPEKYSPHADIPILQIKEFFGSFAEEEKVTGAELVEGWPYLLFNMGRMMEAAAAFPDATPLHDAVKEVVATVVVTDTRFILPGTITMIASTDNHHTPNEVKGAPPFFDPEKRPVLSGQSLVVLKGMHESLASALSQISSDTEMGLLSRIGRAAEDCHTPKYVAHYLKPALRWLDDKTPHGNAKQEIDKIGKMVKSKGVDFYGQPLKPSGHSPHGA